MRTINKVAIATLLTAALSVSTSLHAENIAIVDATVHTMTDSGIMENATILIKNGKIEALQSERPTGSDYQIIDAKGKVVTPGLMGAYTSLGLVEVGFSAGTVDSNSSSTAISSTGAALDVSYAINPKSTLMAISRIAGVTSAATTMSRTGQMFNGQGAIISLADTSSPIIKSNAFLSTSVDNSGANNTGGSRASLWVTLEQVLAEAKFAQGKDLNPLSQWHGISTLADAKALDAFISGKQPVLIQANRAADILQVIALGKRYPNMRLVILNATEGWQVADQIAAANIAVILNPESNLPYEFDQLSATLENAGRLHEAGVTVAIGMDTHNIRLAKQHAGNAVANGLPWEAGLASLTINPAKIYGVSDKVGSIATGMQADLVIWSGDPLEVTETAEQVIINGELVDMVSRQTKLRDRYLEDRGGKSVHYIR